VEGSFYSPPFSLFGTPFPSLSSPKSGGFSRAVEYDAGEIVFVKVPSLSPVSFFSDVLPPPLRDSGEGEVRGRISPFF